MVRVFDRLIGPYARRIRQMVVRGKVTGVDDSGALQIMQASLLEGARDRIERFQQYGLAGNPPAGAESVRLSVQGSPDHSVIIAVEHRKYRMKGLESGEVALYDDQEQVVYLTREGIRIESGRRVTVESPEINLGGDRESLLALVDERIVELINAHTHQVGSATTSPPTAPILPASVCTIKVKAS